MDRLLAEDVASPRRAEPPRLKGKDRTPGRLNEQRGRLATAPHSRRLTPGAHASPEEFFDGRTDTSLHPQLSTRMHGHLCGAKNEAAIVRSSSGVRCAIVAVSFADSQ